MVFEVNTNKYGKIRKKSCNCHIFWYVFRGYVGIILEINIMRSISSVFNI